MKITKDQIDAWVLANAPATRAYRVSRNHGVPLAGSVRFLVYCPERACAVSEVESSQLVPLSWGTSRRAECRGAMSIEATCLFQSRIEECVWLEEEGLDALVEAIAKAAREDGVLEEDTP